MKESADEYGCEVIARVACPACNASPGSPCVMTNGREHQIGLPRITHHLRYALYKRTVKTRRATRRRFDLLGGVRGVAARRG